MGAIESAAAETEHIALGEDRPLQWNVTQSNGSTPQNMSGWTVEFNLLDQQGGQALITKTPATIQNGAATLDQAEVTIDAADWSGITKPGSYFYTLHRSDSGSVALLAFGEFVVHAALAA